MDTLQGVFAASDVYRLISNPDQKAVLRKGAKTLCLEKAIEQVTRRPLEKYSNKNMIQGILQQPKALSMFEEINELQAIKTRSYRWNEHPTILHSKPDAVIIRDNQRIALEIKCPTLPYHCKYLLCKSPAHLFYTSKAAYWQCVAHLVCTDFEKCIFISYFENNEGIQQIKMLDFVPLGGHIEHFKQCLLLADAEKTAYIKQIRGI